MSGWLGGLFTLTVSTFPAEHRSSKGTKTDTDDPEMPSHDRGVSQFLSLHARHPFPLPPPPQPHSWVTGGRAIQWVCPLIVHIEVRQRRSFFFLLEEEEGGGIGEG